MHFFDTSILVAPFDADDSCHEPALSLFIRHANHAAIAVHSLAETFSILTGRRAWRPSQAFEVLRTNTALLKRISLSASDYLRTCETCGTRGIRGGAVYDALILACARKARATHIWTLNARHFHLFAPDLSSRIGEPS